MIGKHLLCDFHIHTRFSDGELSIEEIIDLYGEKKFDVISITDHVLDNESQKKYKEEDRRIPAVTLDDFAFYRESLWQEAQRAWDKYQMILLPGVEITNNTQKFHLLGIDIKEFVDPDQKVEPILQQIRKQGGISVACHPYERNHTEDRQSIHLWENHEQYATLFDAWEVANRDDLFNVVGLKKFNYIANSDFHELRHLYSWKTLLMCEKNPEAVKSAIRLNQSVSIYLFRKEKEAAFNR